jgi:hypothetical protein
MTSYFQNAFIRVRKIAKRDYWIRRVCLFVCLSVGMEKLGSKRTTSIKIDI